MRARAVRGMFSRAGRVVPSRRFMRIGCGAMTAAMLRLRFVLNRVIVGTVYVKFSA